MRAYNGQEFVTGKATRFVYDGHTITIDLTPDGVGIFRNNFERQTQ